MRGLEEVAVVLSADARVVLGEILGHMLQPEGAGVPDVKTFRVRHKSRRDVINGLVATGHLRADGGRYWLTIKGLVDTGSPEAAREIKACDHVLGVLRALYAEQPGKRWDAGEVALRAKAPVDSVALALGFLADRPIWSGVDRSPETGRVKSIDLSEAVLDERPLEPASALDRFRDCVAKLDPAASPAKALAGGLYVEPPKRSLADELAGALLLAPASTHVVVGSVGAGKSTQLLQAREKLSHLSDVRAIYVDVSQRHDLTKELKGTLIILAGLGLIRLLPKNVGDDAVKAARRTFRKLAEGYNEFVPYLGEPPDDDDGDGYYRHQPGVLVPTVPPLDAATRERIDALKVLKAALAPARHVVLLYDSMDRLADVDRFREVVVNDVRALREAGFGVVIVGPTRIVYGKDRPIVDLFDRLHVQGALNARNDESARRFLTDVLERRADNDILPAAQRTALVNWSGGVLRDLIGLARNALEEAFLAGATVVEEPHVTKAADQFGRSRMIGLRDGELATLQRLRTRSTFVPIKDEDLALIESLRVLEYPGIVAEYAVHPTISPLLKELEVF